MEASNQGRSLIQRIPGRKQTSGKNEARKKSQPLSWKGVVARRPRRHLPFKLKDCITVRFWLGKGVNCEEPKMQHKKIYFKSGTKAREINTWKIKKNCRGNSRREKRKDRTHRPTSTGTSMKWGRRYVM